MRITLEDLREQLDDIVERVSLDREDIILLRDGVPTLKLVPYDDDPPSAAFGCMVGTIEVAEDLFSDGKSV